jgi:hypothetical protein
MDKKWQWAAFLLWLSRHAPLGQEGALSLTLVRLNEQLHCVLRQAKSNYSLTQATSVGEQ